MNSKSCTLLLALAVLVLFSPVMADSDSKEIQALTKEVRALRAEVAKLQKSVASLEVIRPTLTTLMPDFAERFHIMHYAGEAGDWAVAAHEFLEMQRMIKVVNAIDPEKGALMKGFMTGSFNKINAAIEHENSESFSKALSETVKNCNACHGAVGSGFINVTLDVNESLSMRHPHQLTRSKMMGQHMHKH
jgi:cytochrome c556